MKYKLEWFNIFFPVFYAAAFFLVVFYAWNTQNGAKRSDSQLYRNLRECETYMKHGFDASDTNVIPDEADGWYKVPAGDPRRRIMTSPLPDIPRRTYLSPFGKPAEEFTISFLLDIDQPSLDYMNGGVSVLPGFFIAGIGENWDIFLNGVSVRSEIHLNENGQILKHRTWRDVYFPVDTSLFVLGTNILSIRIIGDPANTSTGFFYNTAPVYMEEYNIIDKRQHNILLLVLGSIFLFSGLYYLLLFFSINDKKEIFNLYFGIFSLLLSMYAIARNGMVNYMIPDSSISIRLEYSSLILMIPVLGMFIESLLKGKITKVSKIFLAFCSYLGITAVLFCDQYIQEIIYIWDIVSMIYFTYIIAYDMIYFCFFDKHKEKHQWNSITLDMPVGSILIGVIASYFCGIFDIFDALVVRSAQNLFQYGIFVVHIGMVFALSQRFSGMCKRLECSNAILEMTVHERTRELEEQMKIALHATKAKSDFLATMSHEIRTPLNAVIGLSEIELRGKLPESTRSNIMQIHHSGSALLGIINDILDISKIEASAFEIVPVEYDTAAFIDDTVNLNRVRVGSKPINFILEIDGEFPEKLTGDELRVKQILNNLLSNAIKYTREGSVVFSVSHEITSCLNDDEVFVCFTVSDTGIGIKKEDEKKIFTSYSKFDSKANREIEGTGLGLEITKNLVEMMGGTITFESEYEKGTVFKVKIVQKIRKETGCIGSKTAEDLRCFRYTAKSNDDFERSWMPYAKVLVVDDVPVNIMVVEGILEPYGLKVDTASGGQEAVNKITSADPQYDLVFMDHFMPGMDGIEAVKKIREWEKSQVNRKEVPIVALTANALAGNMEMFLSEGFNDFISKPIDIVQVDDVLNKWIRDLQSGETLKKAEEDRMINEASGNPDGLKIPGIDIEKGLGYMGGSLAVYRKILELFHKKADELLPQLQITPDEEKLHWFIIQAHSIKSTSASIGSIDVPDAAAQLEAAGKKGDISFIKENLPDFLERLAKLTGNIKSALKVNAAQDEVPFSSHVSSLLDELETAFESQNSTGVDKILEELRRH